MDRLFCTECGKELHKSSMPVWVLMTDGFEPCPAHPLAKVRVVKSDHGLSTMVDAALQIAEERSSKK